MAQATPGSDAAKEAVVFGGPEWLAGPIVDHLASRGLGVTYIGKSAQGLANVKVLRWDTESMGQLGEIIRALDPRDVSHLVHLQAPTAPLPFLLITPEEWKAAARENLTSAYMLCHHLLPSMIDRGFGRIAFISSLVGRTGTALRTRDACTQAGILGLCRVVALEAAAFNVTANVISLVEIDQALQPEGPLHRPLRLLDIVEACALVFHYRSSFLTGQEIRLTGGRSLW